MGKKKAFWFKVPSQPIFALAGIWRPSADVPAFSFLTTGYDGAPSTHVVGAIHPKACPVILHPEDYDRWLHNDLDDALTLAAAYPRQLMCVRVEALTLAVSKTNLCCLRGIGRRDWNKGDSTCPATIFLFHTHCWRRLNDRTTPKLLLGRRAAQN